MYAQYGVSRNPFASCWKPSAEALIGMTCLLQMQDQAWR